MYKEKSGCNIDLGNRFLYICQIENEVKYLLNLIVTQVLAYLKETLSVQ